MSRRVERTLGLLVLVALAPAARPAAAARAAPPAADVPRERLDKLLDGLPRGTQAALVVADAASGDVLYARHPDLPLKPASVQKLFVTAAALERLGPQFRFETRACLVDQRPGSEGSGGADPAPAASAELWIIGSGDPGLGDERLATRAGRARDHVFAEWAAALHARGVQRLTRIVLDDRIFDDQFRHPDWPDSQADRWYQPPVGGLNLNDNCLDVRAVVRGRELSLELQPPLPDDLLRSTLTVGRQKRAVAKRPGGDVFELSGTVTRTTELGPISAGDPTAFFDAALRAHLARAGLVVAGGQQRPSRAGLPSDAVLVGTHVTTLPEVLWRCNTFSQNLFAECLLKALGSYGPDGRPSGAPGSWPGGTAVLHATMTELGLDLTGADLRDGSGLSHRNRATAGQLVRLLVLMRRHRHADVFIESLAAPGADGTLENRYKDALFRGKLRAKTGTLDGVRALAGYVTVAEDPGAAAGVEKRVLAFALLINGQSDADFPPRVCRALLGEAESRPAPPRRGRR